MPKINTVNVVEVYDEEIIEIVAAFHDNPQGNKEAEELFVQCIKENTEEDIDDSGLDDYVNQGEFEVGTYKILLLHS